MYFEAGKVWGLGIVGDCGKGLVSSFSEAFDAAEVFLASELQKWSIQGDCKDWPDYAHDM